MAPWHVVRKTFAYMLHLQWKLGLFLFVLLLVFSALPFSSHHCLTQWVTYSPPYYMSLSFAMWSHSQLPLNSLSTGPCLCSQLGNQMNSRLWIGEKAEKRRGRKIIRQISEEPDSCCLFCVQWNVLSLETCSIQRYRLWIPWSLLTHCKQVRMLYSSSPNMI